MSDRRGAFEAVWLGAEGGVEGCLSGSEAGFDESAVDIGGGEQSDAGVPVLVVVPVEEGLAVCAGVFDGAEAFGEVGAVFQGFELGFGVGVVVGDLGPGVGFGDAEIGQEQSDGLGLHGGAAVGVEGELAGRDPVGAGGMADEPVGQLGGLPVGDHPSDDTAAEDVEDHIEEEVDPLGGPLELGDVPRPELVGGGGQEFGAGVAGMSALGPAFLGLAARGQQAVEGADRAQVAVFFQQGGEDGAG